MVLKKIAVLVLMSVFSLTVVAQMSKSQKFVDNFERKFGNFKQASTKYQIYYAFSLNKLKQYKKSASVYKAISTKLEKLARKSSKFEKYHYQILKQEVNTSLNAYILSNNEDDEVNFNDALERLEESDIVDDDDLDLFETRYDTYKNEVSSKIREWNYFVQAGLFFHKTSFDLLRNSNGEKIGLLGNFLSNSLGGGLRYENQKNAYALGFNYISGSGTVQSQASATTFLQRDVTTSGFHIDASYFLKRVKGKVDLGINLGFISLGHDVSEPTGFSVERSSVGSITYGIESHYRFTKSMGAGIKFNDAPSLKSSIWQIHFRYQF